MGCREKTSRKIGERRYNKLFLIATEGTKTEKQYFEGLGLKVDGKQVHIKHLKKKESKNSPEKLINLMKDELKKHNITERDEAWIITDKDSWTDEQLNKIVTWSQLKEYYGFALSNPKFEYWLLLHFEEGNNVISSNSCSDKLRRYLRDYDKSIDMGKIDESMIRLAIIRASSKDVPPCKKWPISNGSTVYRLVEKIMI